MAETARQLKEEDFEIVNDPSFKGDIVEGIKLEEQESAMILEMTNYSEKSETHKNNEDSSFVDPEHGTAGVFDGSTEEGKTASGIASEIIKRELASIPEDADLSQTISQMETAFRNAHQAILAEITANPDLIGMSTSATIVKFFNGPEGRKAIVVNAGDSRAYIRRKGQSTIEQVTDDDNMVEYLITNGGFKNNQDLRQAMTDKGAELLVNALLSKEEIAKRKQDQTYNSLVLGAKLKFRTLDTVRGLTTNSLGGNTSEPRVTIVDISDGDQILLTSDGVHDNLANEEIINSLSNEKSLGDNAKALITKAREASQSEYTENPSEDDMTCVVIRVEDVTPLGLSDLLVDDEGTLDADTLVSELEKLAKAN